MERADGSLCGNPRSVAVGCCGRRCLLQIPVGYEPLAGSLAGAVCPVLLPDNHAVLLENRQRISGGLRDVFHFEKSGSPGGRPAFAKKRPCGFSLGGAAAYALFCWTLLGLMWYPATHAARWLLDEIEMPGTWYVFWILPVVFLSLNIAMRPPGIFHSFTQTGL